MPSLAIDVGPKRLLRWPQSNEVNYDSPEVILDYIHSNGLFREAGIEISNEDFTKIQVGEVNSFFYWVSAFLKDL